MAFNKLIPTWIENYSSDGTDMTIPIATLPLLTAAEADEATGDIRKLLLALLDYLYGVWAATGATDRPGKMTVTRRQELDRTSGELTDTYTFVFKTQVTTHEMEDES